MYKTLIASYVKNLKYEDVENYILKNFSDINVSVQEMEIIYDYIKNKWERIYDEDPALLNELRTKLSKEVYEEVIGLLNAAYEFKKG